MKKSRKKAIWTTLAGLSLISTALVATTDYAEAIGFGGGTGFKIIPTQIGDDGETVIKYKYNPNLNNDHARWYRGKELYREVYTPQNPDLPGGFVWYTVVPQDRKPTASETYLGNMLENTQTIRGNGGDHLVPGAGLNLKYGSSDPWTGDYEGNNTGTKTIQYGTYKGKRYEWRFTGYNMYGSVVGNPFFPADSQSSALQRVSTKAEYGQYWSRRDWIEKGWELPKSINTFGPSDDLNKRTQKIDWIEKYFFKDYPAFRSVGNASYWANYLRPLTDPSKETGVWLGWHHAVGVDWYNTFITTPPEQPNLRLVNYKIYDSENKLVAQQTRNGTAYTVSEESTKVDIKNRYIHKGETYRIEVDVKNMPQVPNNIKNSSITMEHMYSFDDVIGDSSRWSTSIQTDTAEAPNNNKLSTGQVAHFTYNYTVPTTAKPKEDIQFYAKIPGKFYNKGYNTITSDDDASIELKIAPENLGVEFEGYYDMNRNLVDYVTPNYEMWVKYKVTKTNGQQPVNGADLKIKLSDTKTVTTNQTYQSEGAYDKKGRLISDGILKKEGDYAIFWASVTPRQPKVCTEASILAKWATKGVNNDPTDDVAKPACLINPDNIAVSNFVAKPQTVFLSKSQSKKSVQYTVSFNLTNYNYDKKDKVIPLVFTIDGKVVKTEEVPVQSLKTMKISRILPAVSVGEGEHIVQVEANPKPRKYVEVRTNSNGVEVDPYTDNIGWDKVNVERNKNDDFRCAVAHTTNYWNTRFTISTWHGYYVSGCTPYYDSRGRYAGCSYYSYIHYDWEYDYPTVGFNESQKIEHIYFRSKFTTDKQGGWVDLLNSKGTIKAGYGFELKVVTHYQTNTYNDTPKPFNYGYPYGRNVSPQYSAVDSSARVKVTMPFTDDSGQPIALVLDGNQTGHWSNTTTTYELESRTVINKPEKKVYINENTKDGNYNVRIETEPFYGSYDKPSTSARLCDIKNVTIEVKGSYLDDVKTHVVQ